MDAQTLDNVAKKRLLFLNKQPTSASKKFLELLGDLSGGQYPQVFFSFFKLYSSFCSFVAVVVGGGGGGWSSWISCFFLTTFRRLEIIWLLCLLT